MKVLHKENRLTTISEVLEIFSTHPTAESEVEKTVAYTIKNYCSSALNLQKAIDIENELVHIGLFPLEVCQIIDMQPKSLLDLQIVIEDMEDRYSIDQLDRILYLFQNNEN